MIDVVEVGGCVAEVEGCVVVVIKVVERRVLEVDKVV